MTDPKPSDDKPKNDLKRNPDLKDVEPGSDADAKPEPETTRIPPEPDDTTSNDGSMMPEGPPAMGIDHIDDRLRADTLQAAAAGVATCASATLRISLYNALISRTHATTRLKMPSVRGIECLFKSGRTVSHG